MVIYLTTDKMEKFLERQTTNTNSRRNCLNSFICTKEVKTEIKIFPPKKKKKVQKGYKGTLRNFLEID